MANRHSIVDDRELQELYNQVLAGFADESPTDGFPATTGPSRAQQSTSATVNPRRPPISASPASAVSASSVPATSTSRTGTQSPSTRSIGSFEDGGGKGSQRSQHSQSHSTAFSNSPVDPKRRLPSPASSPMSAVNRRPLPRVPGGSLSDSDPRRPGPTIPSSPKDPRGLPPRAPLITMPVPDVAPVPAYSPATNGSLPHRTPSYRPPGARPANIPGTDILVDDDSSRYSSIPAPPPPPTSSGESPYFPYDRKESQLYRPSPSSLVPPPPPELHHHPSSDDILAVGSTGVVRRISGDSSSSSSLSRANLTRNTTASTVSSATSWPNASTAGTRTPDTSENGDHNKIRFSSGTTGSSTSSAYAGPSTASSFYPGYIANSTLSTNTYTPYGVDSSTPGPSYSGGGYATGNGNGHTNGADAPRPPPSETSTARQPPSRLAGQIASVMKGAPAELYDDVSEEYEDFENLSDDEFDTFANFALLSNIAVWLRDEVPRGTHVKGSIPYPRAFTGKDIVNTLQTQIRRVLINNQGDATHDRYIALLVARSLQQQLFFYEVEWGARVLQDGVEDVYMFLDDVDGPSSHNDGPPERQELPTSVITVLTRCYSPNCSDEAPCYAFSCPRKVHFEAPVQEAPVAEPVEASDKEWAESVEPSVLRSLPSSEVNRQTIIHRLITKEAQYVRDLELIESLFIRVIRYANPPLFATHQALESFLDDVFGNLPSVRDANRRLLDMMNVRQREHALVIKRIGDVLLEAATEFRLVYPTYVAHVPMAEKRLKEEVEKNLELRLLLDQCQRRPEARRLDLKTFLNRPSEHLQKYEITLEAIANETDSGNPDADYLLEAVQAFRSLQMVCQLQAWQHAMCKGPMGKFEWHNLLSEEARQAIAKKEQKRQNIIFELIKGEMQYVKDLENIDVMYVQPLLQADPPIIPRERVRGFIDEVFHNFAQLHAHHERLLERLHATQRDEHPVVHSVTAAVFDAALNWRESYMEYITNYPKAEYRIVEEMANNPLFKDFVEQQTRHPDANRLDMKNFVNRPIPRLARYELLLKSIMDASPENHEDRDSIPHVIEVIKALLKETEPGVASAEQKVELWKYNANLVWKAGEYVDLDLLDDNRSLIHAGKLLRPPDTGFEWNGWSELFVLLFDNYLVMTKPKDKEKDGGVMKYHVTRRPIPLELLTVANFTDPPTQRSAGILRFGKGGGGGNATSANDAGPAGTLPPPGASPDAQTDSRVVYPCTLHHTGRLGGLHVLYAESASARAEWREKLAEAQGLRKVVQEANKVFEVETLSVDTFLAPSYPAAAGAASGGAWSAEAALTGQVTCSVPFTTADGRALVAVGCAEGVWIGFRHDPRSMRRVLHLKMVTQCAMLEEFGIFLVLADKSLFAYHIEALVPSSPHLANTSQTPQKLNGTKDVHFFSVGKLGERTLVIYMKKKGMDSIFRVLEPVVDKINEKTKQPISFGSRLGFRAARSDWFRVYKDFFLPSEAYDLIFLKARIAVLCTKGFEIMDLNDFKSVTIPQRDENRQEKLSKRCESCRPMGMFRVSENEFLLCYDEFGLFVNRHGDPSRDKPLIEWEGTAERVAWHPPYVLIFDTRFIEIRTVETGRLCQIIQGEDVRMIWDGRGTSQPPPNFPKEGQTWQDIFSLETRVHGVMRAPDPTPTTNGPLTARRPVVAQHVFELVPTIPLYVPERIGSPTPQQFSIGGGYQGPMSNSPPQSPRNSTASMTWR